MTARWGAPVRRAPVSERTPLAVAPQEDMARLVERRAARALPGVPDNALDRFTGDPTLLAALEDA